MENRKKPKVRFKEFKKDWTYCNLKDISDKVTEKNKNNEYTETFTNSAEFGIINQRDFFDKDISNKKSLNGYYIVRNDDFVYNPRISNFAPVGPIKRNKLGRTGVVSPLYYVFRTHNIDKRFLEYFFDSTLWHRFMKLNGDSGARADRFAIKDSVFKEMPLPFPNLTEQKKIGEFLDDLTYAISLHQQELTTLKQTKQGFLQKMFPKEGEKVPEVRFPGFTDNWKQLKLGEVAEKISVGIATSSSQYFSTSSNGVPFVKNQDIKENKLNTEKLEYISHEFDEQNKNKRIKAGDILTARTGYPGLSAVVPQELDGAQTFTTLITRIKKSIVIPYFVSLFINSPKGMKQISGMEAGGAQKNVNAGILQNLIVPVPSINEQTKISSFIEQFDETIFFHQRELELLQLTKKAFLQKLFV